MVIKKFIAKTEEDALEAARKELGEGVVIMNVKAVKRRGLFKAFRSKQVEVTVALEENVIQKNASPKPASEEIKLPVNPVGLTSQPVNTESLEKKLDSLQKLLEGQMRQAEEERRAAASKEEVNKEHAEAEEKNESTSDSAVQSENPEQDKFIRLLYNTMIDNEVDEKYANQILEDIDKCKKPNTPFDYILSNTYQKMVLKFGKSEGIIPAQNGPKVVLFIGPTGVGKTTTIAKIASCFSLEEKKRVALLTTDTYRIAAAEQLRTYANILEVPFRVIYSDEEFLEAISDFQECDYIFVDTTGHSHQNEEQFGRIEALLKSIPGETEYQTFLVLSATTKYKDLLKITEKYQGITNYQLIFTKTDETNSLGNLLNIKLHVDTPIAYITSGQNVPDDIEVFNPQKMVKQLLGGKS